ncbi:Solute carrier family 13 member 5, partial [Orchesella cincta]
MAGFNVILRRSWKFFVALSVPLILLPVLFADDQDDIPYPNVGTRSENVAAAEDGEEPLLRKSPKFKLAYVILVMAVYWALEIIPLPITSLFPLVLFPLFGIDDAANVSKSYMKESNTIFLGGAIVALAIEYCNLHRRVGLKLITILGVSPRRLMFGIMVGVSFLSMWISNTTCTTMIVPIIVAIVDEIHDVTDATSAEAELQHDQIIQSRRASNLDVSAPGTRRHSAVFGNSGLSSHRRHSSRDSESSTEGDVPRSTLGMLQGHRSEEVERRFSNPHLNPGMPNRRHQELRNPNRRGSLPPLTKLDVVDENKTSPRPIHLQIERLKTELAAEGVLGRRPSNLPIDFNQNNLRHSRNSVASLTEPGRIAIIINLPTPTSDMDESTRRKRTDKEKWRRIKNMYLFALAYAANIGGTATITGTGPNKVFKEVIKPYGYLISKGDEDSVGMTFFTWLAFNFPPMLVNIVVAWLYLSIKYCGFFKFSRTPSDEEENTLRRWKEQQVRNYMREEYKKLGKMTFHEIGVGIVFLLVVILWILRDPQIFVGWGEALSDTQTGDSTAALMGACLLFIIPKSWDFLTKSMNDWKDGARLEALLDWKYVTQKLPWGVLLLLGSGYAIGDSADRTGLTRRLGKMLFLLHPLPSPLILLIVMLITALITEVVSNTACASVILPVLLGLSQEMGIHPFYLSVAAAVTASYAFMLPVASPVNAIVFAAGDFSIWEMITNGYILNAICVLVFYINTLTLGECLFEYSEFTYPPPPNITLDLDNMTSF